MTREVISSINQDVLVAVIANFEKRINFCIEQLGVVCVFLFSV